MRNRRRVVLKEPKCMLVNTKLRYLPMCIYTDTVPFYFSNQTTREWVVEEAEKDKEEEGETRCPLIRAHRKLMKKTTQVISISTERNFIIHIFINTGIARKRGFFGAPSIST